MSLIGNGFLSHVSNNLGLGQFGLVKTCRIELPIIEFNDRHKYCVMCHMHSGMSEHLSVFYKYKYCGSNVSNC